ncbi:hypothetical protein [Gemmiger qucibialis]|uniref:hypothetical protein n=1 Tax=Gemmiger qucibialis TaxID=2997294 RepID=UPI0022E37CD5|nr:hypothetical protein [Gemmiger qucibialis]
MKKFQTDGGLEANGISTGQNADSPLPVLPKRGQQKGRDDLNRPGLATVLAGNKKRAPSLMRWGAYKGMLSASIPILHF